MPVIDYARSYLFFTARGGTNTARLQVEARCELCDLATQARETLFFFASCKAENTHVPGPLFQDPNYDFCGVFSEREFAIYRTPAWHDTDRGSRGPIEGTFDSARQVIRWVDARLLETGAHVAAATLDSSPLVGQTGWQDREAGFEALLEYPIKTMNVHPETRQYQIDTGPLPFPDGGREIARIVPAFIAWKSSDLAEFILQRPTPVVRDGRELCQVLHYSQIRELSVTNKVLAVGG
jgi:hypothetical protein